MARKYLGDWGTYYYISGNNVPNPAWDSDARWRLEYEQSVVNGVGVTTIYVTPRVNIVNDNMGEGAMDAVMQTTIGSETKSQIIESNFDIGTEYGVTQVFTIQHASDGTASCAFRGNYGFKDPGYPSPGKRMYCSHTYALPTINLASTITNNTSVSSRKDFGIPVTFVVDSANASILNTLKYTINNTEYTIGTITGDGTLSYTFPANLISNYPGNVDVGINVTCVSSNGTTSSTMVYLKVPDSYVPTISLALTDVGVVPSNWGIYVKGKSKLRGVITATGAGGSTISSYAAIANNQSFNATPFETTELNTVGSNVITASVVDSRGRTASTSQTKTVYDYSSPTYVKTEVIRCDNNGTENNDGTYGKVVCQYSISPCNNKNAKSLVVTYGNVSKTFTLSGYSGTIIASTSQLFSGLDVTANHTFTFKLIDSFNPNGIEQSYVMPPSYVLMSKRAGGKGITFGRIATADGFHVYMDAQFHNTLKDSAGNNITSPNNGKLTIQKNGTTVKTFTANASSDVTVDITVPIKTSELTNDSGFITGLTITQIRNDSSYGTQKTYTNGYKDYKLFVILGKSDGSNSGYNTAVVPAALVSSSGVSILLADESAYVRGTLKSSGNDLIYLDNARKNTGFIQYIYGVK